MLFKLTNRWNESGRTATPFHESVGSKGSKKGCDGGYTNPEHTPAMEPQAIEPWVSRLSSLGQGSFCLQ